MISAAPGLQRFCFTAGPRRFIHFDLGTLHHQSCSQANKRWTNGSHMPAWKMGWDGFPPKYQSWAIKTCLRKNEHLEANGITSSLRRRKGTLRSVEMCQENAQVVAWVYLDLFQRWKPQSSPCHWYGTIVCYPPLLDAHNHGLRVAHQFSRTSTHTLANLRYPAPPVHYINHNYVSPVWHHWVLLCKAGVGGRKLALLQPSATIYIFYMYMLSSAQLMWGKHMYTLQCVYIYCK